MWLKPLVFALVFVCGLNTRTDGQTGAHTESVGAHRRRRTRCRRTQRPTHRAQVHTEARIQGVHVHTQAHTQGTGGSLHNCHPSAGTESHFDQHESHFELLTGGGRPAGGLPGRRGKKSPGTTQKQNGTTTKQGENIENSNKKCGNKAGTRREQGGNKKCVHENII